MFLALCITPLGWGSCIDTSADLLLAASKVHGSFFLSLWLLCMHNQHQCYYNVFESKFTCILHYVNAKKGCACL